MGVYRAKESGQGVSQKSCCFLQAGITMASITVGVLALQGAFYEHIQLLKKAVSEQSSTTQWEFIEVRTPQELDRCDALILPGGESTTISLVAARSNLLEPLRDFVKYVRALTPRLSRQCD
jgi:5'-phosphate synthase pdxT subunit